MRIGTSFIITVKDKRGGYGERNVRFDTFEELVEYYKKHKERCLLMMTPKSQPFFVGPAKFDEYLRGKEHEGDTV